MMTVSVDASSDSGPRAAGRRLIGVHTHMAVPIYKRLMHMCALKDDQTSHGGVVADTAATNASDFK